MAYTPTTWVDDETPVDATNLNKIEAGLASAEEVAKKGQVNGYAALDGTGKIPVAQVADLSATYQPRSEKAVINGYASLGADGKVPTAQLPPLSGASYGTTLPASPVDGQEAILVDSITNPTYQWRFRYNAGSTSPYKWEFVGGSGASQSVAAFETTTTVGSFVDLATIGPRVTAPQAGDYEVAMSAAMVKTALDSNIQIGVGVGAFATAAALVQAISGSAVANTYSNPAVIGVIRALAAGSELRMRYYQSTAGSASAQMRMLRVVPVRVA